jgi:D-alanyl-lipoteichoic acid acyltransferase DltB (MBOAT superfamily)
MQKNEKNKKWYLLLALITDVGLLLIFKYSNFATTSLNETLHLSLPQFSMLLPLGISFYTLQTVGYLLDVYKGTYKAETHLGYFALFVSFFPVLTAGPIERGDHLIPQLRKTYVFNYADVSEGAKLLLLGLFKKMVLADNFGLIVDRMYTDLTVYRGISLVLLIILYTWQIYMDFSGYTDMARGVAKMLGITLFENFNLPYLSTSIQDFWRRWHISLSSWLRDYIYFPLGGNRKGLFRTVINTLIVFTISGLWHGAAWTFVFWGLLHGIAISAERILKQIVKLPFQIPRFIQIFYAYLLLSIFWVFFRSPTLTDSIYILRNSIVGLKNFVSPSYISASLNQVFHFDIAEIIITLGLLLLALILELIQRKQSLIQLIGKQPVIMRYVIYTLLVFLIIQLRNAQIKEFIYVQF